MASGNSKTGGADSVIVIDFDPGMRWLSIAYIE